MPPTPATADSVKTHFARVRDELARVIVGHVGLIKHLYICLLCGGHALIEGVPGLGKTLVVKSLSRVLALQFSRIQFTPDLMPADILGTNIVKTDAGGNRYFEFFKGPLFGQLVLADEINRASPKTQSALLEAMQEERVTVFGQTYALDPPFMVLATQNPIEMEGTYPLPEAQIDRFFFKLTLTYPNQQELAEIIAKTTREDQPALQPVLGAEAILAMRSLIRSVPIATHVRDYAIRLVLASHGGDDAEGTLTRKYVLFGASPRGLQALVLAGKASALMNGRFNVALEDIRNVAKSALRHRVVLNIRGRAEGVTEDEVIDEILTRTPYPTGR
ncbi:MAG: MoxR family ATPase [Desulfobacterales bacterium]|nr:MoxR family ATPase [Desulfobacterales bacterium]